MSKEWKNPVRSQMGGASAPSTALPSQARGTLEAPFNKPQDLGNGGIPSKMVETLGRGKGTSIKSTFNPAFASKSAQGTTRTVQKATPPKNGK